MENTSSKGHGKGPQCVLGSSIVPVVVQDARTASVGTAGLGIWGQDREEGSCFGLEIVLLVGTCASSLFSPHISTSIRGSSTQCMRTGCSWPPLWTGRTHCPRLASLEPCTGTTSIT